MTLAHPEVKRRIKEWESELREMTGNKALFVVAFTPPSVKCQIKDLAPIICDEMKVPINKINLKSKKTEMVQARQLLSYYGTLCGLSLHTVARELGFRDHTTVIHGRNKIRDLIQTGDEWACNMVIKINKRLEERNNETH